MAEELLGSRVARLLDPLTGQERELFSDYLPANKWHTLVAENFEANTLIGLLKRSDWKRIFADRIVQYPGMRWNLSLGSLEDPFFRPVIEECSLELLLHRASGVFARCAGRHIGVQLSGGVDSSIIIGLLRAFDIPYSLVGLSTERYEFRTERYVQLKLADQCGRAELIDYETCLPLSGLDQVSAHCLPDISCINFTSDTAMAEACKRLGVEVLFSGSGGDVVLGTEVPHNPVTCSWQPQIFNYTWPKEVIYAGHGVELVSFYDDQELVNGLYNMRRGQGDDGDKLWARRFFRDFLPSELVDFTYRADYWGVYVDGLQGALTTVQSLCHRAYELTGNPYFSPENLAGLLKMDLLQTDKILYQKIESRAALGTWINSLSRLFDEKTA